MTTLRPPGIDPDCQRIDEQTCHAHHRRAWLEEPFGAWLCMVCEEEITAWYAACQAERPAWTPDYDTRAEEAEQAADDAAHAEAERLNRFLCDD
jgi:hypothetical protein